MANRNTPEKFWGRVRVAAPDVCWEWTGSKNSGGYGTVSWAGSVVQAHRLAYVLARGHVRLQTGFRVGHKAKTYRRFVLHKCDNRLCCNPGHLFLGSMRTNQLDAYAKGRRSQPKSEHVNAKLSATDVIAIRQRYGAGQGAQTELAREYGVSQRAISLVVRRETYKDIP